MDDPVNRDYFLAASRTTDPWPGAFFFSWERDLDQRLAWLYGDPEQRKREQAGDLKAWRRLGWGKL